MEEKRGKDIDEILMGNNREVNSTQKNAIHSDATPKIIIIDGLTLKLSKFSHRHNRNNDVAKQPRHFPLQSHHLQSLHTLHPPNNSILP
jgi:alpha-D-ribose 1-methylphosphonate 5-triphosphate synthase subunit PhnI